MCSSSGPILYPHVTLDSAPDLISDPVAGGDGGRGRGCITRAATYFHEDLEIAISHTVSAVEEGGRDVIGLDKKTYDLIIEHDHGVWTSWGSFLGTGEREGGPAQFFDGWRSGRAVCTIMPWMGRGRDKAAFRGIVSWERRHCRGWGLA